MQGGLRRRTRRNGTQALRAVNDQNDVQIVEATADAPTSHSSRNSRLMNSVAGIARMFSDSKSMSQAREAEALTMDYERARLKDLGIDKELEWKGLDDCFAGYDVLSYDPGELAPTNRMIEVTSAITSPLRFIIARNEWEQAQKLGAAYIFHVWDLQKTTPILYERTTEQVAKHIPSDNGKGRWLTVEILLDD